MTAETVLLIAAAGVAWWAFGPLFLWRWFTGYPLDGKFRTNASWTRRASPGEDGLNWPHPVTRWHYWPWLRRGAIRTAATVLGVLLPWLYFAYTAVFLGAATVFVAASVYAGGWWTVWKVRNWRHHRDWVNPLNEALPPAVTVRELARDRSRTVLALDPSLVIDDKVKQVVMLTASAKLALPAADLRGDWSKLHGKKPVAEITYVPPPPGFVSFGEIQPYADTAEDHEVCFGLGRPDRKYPKGVPHTCSVANDSPHLGFSMGSGDGKSVTARCVACQLAHHGALIAVLDAKLMSQHWAAGLPNVAYARTPAEIHELAIWLAKEVDRRNEYAMLHADVEGKVHGDVGPRIAGILEELNITQGVLATYWKSIGGKGKSPAVLALDFVVAAGRQVNVNLIYIGQRLSAKATSAGSGDARENLGVLLFSNPSKRTWDMLVSDRHALPPATDKRGRLQVVTASAVTEVQGAYVTGAQAREYAMSGTVAVPRDDMPCVGGLAPVGTPERAAQDVQDIPAIEGQRPDLHIVQDIPGPALSPPRITIKEAVAEGISGPSEAAVSKALRRHPAPPVPVGRRGNADEYDRVEWCDWEEARRQPRRKAIR